MICHIFSVKKNDMSYIDKRNRKKKISVEELGSIFSYAAVLQS